MKESSLPQRFRRRIRTEFVCVYSNSSDEVLHRALRKVLDPAVRALWQFFFGHPPLDQRSSEGPLILLIPADERDYHRLVVEFFQGCRSNMSTHAFTSSVNAGWSPVLAYGRTGFARRRTCHCLSVVAPLVFDGSIRSARSRLWTVRQVLHELTHQVLRVCRTGHRYMGIDRPVWLEEGLARPEKPNLGRLMSWQDYHSNTPAKFCAAATFVGFLCSRRPKDAKQMRQWMAGLAPMPLWFGRLVAFGTNPSRLSKRAKRTVERRWNQFVDISPYTRHEHWIAAINLCKQLALLSHDYDYPTKL